VGARCVRSRLLLALALATALAALPGCTYFGNRSRDAAETFALVVTWSRKPQFGLCMNCPVSVLGWVGVTANIRWLEIPDFFLGWTGLDISGDDLEGAAGAEPAASGDREAGSGA